jgi:hypothetical protein
VSSATALRRTAPSQINHRITRAWFGHGEHVVLVRRSWTRRLGAGAGDGQVEGNHFFRIVQNFRCSSTYLRMVKQRVM